MHEIELKILLDDTQEKRLRTSSTLADLTETGPTTRSLVSIYYDTPDQALRRAGIALRLRRKGRAWVQTVKKASAPISGGLSQPIEDEISVRGQTFALERIGDDDLREEVIGLTRPGVAPVCQTRLRRIVHILRSPGGGSVELAIDRGDVGADGVSAPLIEAELELIDGHPGDLYDLAAILFPQGPVRFSNLSKSARARMLVEKGHAVEPLAPRKSARVTLERGQTAEQAARLVLGECLDQVLANIPVVVGTDDPGGPHQLRVGLRRLRSALAAFRPALGRARLDPIAATARRIGAETGRLRDLDVLAGELLAPLAAARPDQPGFAALGDAIDARRREVRDQVRTALCGPDITGFVFSTSGFLAGRGWLDPADHDQTMRLARPVEKLARRRLDRRWRALSGLGRRIEDLTIDQRHDMRKEIKKLRYVVEIFAGLFDPDRVAAFRSALRKLQDAFGALNDAAMAEDCLLAADAPGLGDPMAQRAAGWLIGIAQTRADHLWPKAVADWAALAKSGPFWR